MRAHRDARRVGELGLRDDRLERAAVAGAEHDGRASSRRTPRAGSARAPRDASARPRRARRRPSPRRRRRRSSACAGRSGRPRRRPRRSAAPSARTRPRRRTRSSRRSPSSASASSGYAIPDMLDPKVERSWPAWSRTKSRLRRSGRELAHVRIVAGASTAPSRWSSSSRLGALRIEGLTVLSAASANDAAARTTIVAICADVEPIVESPCPTWSRTKSRLRRSAVGAGLLTRRRARRRGRARPAA